MGVTGVSGLWGSVWMLVHAVIGKSVAGVESSGFKLKGSLRMKIGELALAAATQVETIRFYEREGLMPAPARTAGNYRVYGEVHAQRLNFIRRCRGLDMALDEIRALLAFKDEPAGDCTAVDQLLDAHIAHVAARIEELAALQEELTLLRARCQSAEPGQHCGILQELSQGGSTANVQRPVSASHAHVGPVHRPRRNPGT